MKVRMPSGMVGQKSMLFEGGIRNFLAVQGPGVPAGTTDSKLLSVTDILPTISDLASIRPGSIAHMAWDGISFMNRLAGETTGSSAGSRRSSSSSAAMQQQQQQQEERMVFVMGPYCWDADTVPELDSINRWVIS
jgi:arylsulfatase A-like enzyme